MSRWTKQLVWCYEFGTLSIGPFEEGIVVEIMDAFYGIPNDLERQVDLTDYVREHYSPKDGLRMSGFSSSFGDPAPMSLKRMSVEYRVTNILAKPSDISRAQYSEGTMSQLQKYPVWMFKAASNFVGCTLAAGGLFAGKVHTSLRNILSGQPHDVADSELLQIGFSSWLHCNGIWPTVEYEPLPDAGRAEDMKLTPLIVCNHQSYIDGPVLATVFVAPRIIAMKGTCEMPFIGNFAHEIGVMEVDRASKDSRKDTINAITTHAESWTPGTRPLMLFPEGTTSNGDGLLPFKKGAFLPGVPVRPVVLTYSGSWHPANTNFKVNRNGMVVKTGDAEWTSEFFGHLIHSLQIKVLPPYTPSEEEKADAELYAANVHKLMSKAYAQLQKEVEERKQMSESESFTAVASRAVTGVANTVTMPLQTVVDFFGANLFSPSSREDPEESRARSAGPAKRGSRFKRRDNRLAAYNLSAPGASAGASAAAPGSSSAASSAATPSMASTPAADHAAAPTDVAPSRLDAKFEASAADAQAEAVAADAEVAAATSASASDASPLASGSIAPVDPLPRDTAPVEQVEGSETANAAADSQPEEAAKAAAPAAASSSATPPAAAS